MAASGALESIVLKGRRFSTGNDDTVNIALSGYHNETVVHSDGTFDIKKVRHIGKMSGIKVACDDGKEDQEFLQELRDELEPFTMNATLVTGVVYMGKVTLTEEGERDLSTNYIEITVEGDIQKM